MTPKNSDNVWEDPIVAIHAWREAHAQSFNYDPDAMFQDLIKRQQKSKGTVTII